jgi:hypothetical protein
MLPSLRGPLTPREGTGQLPVLLLDRGQLPPTTLCLSLGGSKERNMKPTASKLIRWAGLAALVAGIIFAGIQSLSENWHSW